MNSEPFIPALGYHILTPFYDILNTLAARKSLIHKIIADEFQLRDSDKLLDLGCGTGSLIQSLRRSNSEFEAYGIDVDPRILDIAKTKGKKYQDQNTSYIQASATRLPFENDHFDAVVSTLLFHHLMPEEKRQSLKEIYRVIKPNGLFVLVDWGKPSNLLMRVASLAIQALDGVKTTRENLEGKLLELVKVNQFQNPLLIRTASSIVGTIEIIKASK